MSIDRIDVKHVALLSRLEFDENDLDTYSKQLASILSYIGKLNEIDTSNVHPTSHPLSTLKNVFRKDVLKKSLPPSEVLANAPSKEGDLFKVPQIIEGK
jgi:aspartyl-tRNA(Asn)/glutamyl-tRNA(Gln) amidotransferase subunit C